MRKKVVKLMICEEISEKERYSNEVRMYLRKHSDTFLTEFAALCEKTNGRVSYERMLDILGRDYPKATWIDRNDIKQQIEQFFMEVGIPFRADDSHLYFP